MSQLSDLWPHLPAFSPASRQAIGNHLSMVMQQVPSLNLRIAQYVHNDGHASNVLLLFGTIPIFFKGASYNIPVNIWLLENYPQEAPRCYVTPTEDMRIKERHRNVDLNGFVTLRDFTWSASQTTLLDFLQIIMSVFSDNPPVYAIDRGDEIPYAEVVSRPAAVQAQARAHAEANPAAAKKDQLVAEVGTKLRTELARRKKQTTEEIEGLLEQQRILQSNNARTRQALASLRAEKGQLMQCIENLTKKSAEIEAWCAANEQKDKMDLDHVVVPADVYSRQILDAVADDHAFDDTMYALDKALQNGHIPLQQYLRLIRKMAREQFLSRALSIKLFDAQKLAMSH